MKKCFILSAVLSVMAVCALVFCHKWIGDTHDAVSVEMETITGDVSAAEGLYANIATKSGYYASWDTGFYVTSDPEEDVTFYYNKPRRNTSREAHSYVELRTNFNYAVSSTGNLNINEYEPYELIKIVADNTAAGESHTQTLSLKNYYTYLPLKCDVYINTGEYRDYSVYEEKILDYIKIPMMSGVRLEITVEKSKNGNVSNIEVSGYDADIFTQYAAAENGIYFMLDVENMTGIEKKFAEMPCGYGIYYLPYDEEEDIRTVKTFDPYEVKLVTLDISGDGKTLYLLTLEDDMWVVYVYSADDCSLIERFVLGEREGSVVYPYPEDSYIMYIFTHGRVSLINDEGGEYALAVNCVIDINYYFNIAYDWDGKRLAICDYDWTWLRDLEISVLSGEDVLYRGRIQDSQEHVCELNYNADDDIVRLEFK